MNDSARRDGSMMRRLVATAMAMAIGWAGAAVAQPCPAPSAANQACTQGCAQLTIGSDSAPAGETVDIPIGFAQGADDGPLSGKTIGLKDHIAVAGVPMTLGSHFLDGYTPDFDATVVTRLLDAGATIVGKMNMEDFSFGGPGVAGVGDFGRPLNPHNPDYVTGGSSS